MAPASTKQTLKYQIWLYGGRLLDLKEFAPVNSSARFIYLEIILPFLKRKLQDQFPNGELIARHSAKSGLYFNLFFSDLDLTVVLKESPTDEVSFRITQFFQSWKRIFPFLGEIEIFTEEESNRFQLLIGTAPEFFQVVRDIRKIRWLMGDEEAAQSKYHQYKAQRSLQVLARKHSMDPSENKEQVRLQLGKRLGSILDGLGYPSFGPSELNLGVIHCEHLNWDPEKDLGLNPKQSWALLSVLPSQGRQLKEAQYLDELRQSKNLSPLYRAYLEAEAIQLLAVYRARPEQFPWMKALSQKLMDCLAENGA